MKTLQPCHTAFQPKINFLVCCDALHLPKPYSIIKRLKTLSNGSRIYPLFYGYMVQFQGSVLELRLAASCASAKKKTPTMEILPDKKELIMKGGTFQEQLSAFQ